MFPDETMQETDMVPFSASAPVGGRVLVLAPHPDDETLGCGGSIRLLAEKGVPVKVLFLTRGDKALPGSGSSYSALREKEAKKALRILGISDYEFFRYPDRELYAGLDDMSAAVSARIDEFRPDTLYSPSVIDLNPDHRAAAGMALALQERYGLSVAFYELTTPIRPNVLVDISGVFGLKRKAIKAYKSQLKITDYLRLVTALNTYRTFTLGKKVSYAEAFWVLSGKWEAEKMLSWLHFGGLVSKKPHRC